MKRVILLSSMLLYFILCAFGQDSRITDLEKRIEQLEQKVLILELTCNNEKIESDQKYSNNSSDILNWRKVRVDMKDDDIRNLLGEPTEITRFNKDLYVWRYSTRNGNGYIRFNKEGVFSWNEPNKY